VFDEGENMERINKREKIVEKYVFLDLGKITKK